MTTVYTWICIEEMDMEIKQLKMLLIEDSEDDALLLSRELIKQGYEPDIKRVVFREEIQAALLDSVWDIIISDHNMPGLSSDAVLEMVLQSNCDAPFIIVSGSIGEDIAVAAMKMGAHDYIMKDNLTRLVPAIERELRESKTRIEHKKAQAIIQHMAYHDALTGLTNRNEFETRLKDIFDFHKSEKKKHVLLYIDLDQFKIINDTCGHVAGDTLLKQLAEILKNSVRSSDTLSRLGGDEFGVLLTDCSIKGAMTIAETILNDINDFRFSWEGKSFVVGASIGLIHFSGSDYRDIAAILSAADMACYEAKDLGRNRIQVYQHDNQNMLQRRGEMLSVSELNNALESNSFVLFQQKIVSLNDKVNDQHFSEALLRMVSPQGKLVMPGAFIPAAERYNIMPKLDRWVIEHVFEHLSLVRNQANSPEVMFINLSGNSLSDDSLFVFIRDKLKCFNIPAEQICFEITETAAIINLNDAVAFIKEIKSEGFKFALDDFGAGLSSFSYLKAIPVDFIKIDGSFICDMLDDPMDAAIVESVNRIGHVAGLKTIAEFAESEEILHRINEVGIDFAQGYGIHRPEYMCGMTLAVNN